MKTLTPQEATDLAYNTTGALMLFHAILRRGCLLQRWPH